MKAYPFAFVLLLPILTLAADRTPAPLPAEKAAKSLVLPDGFHATLFASEPDVIQPISFCHDSRGRLFVAEAMNYGEWKATGKDRIIILEDRDGDGRSDSRKLFYEGFNYITGIEVGFGGVWVMSPPGLYFIPDRDGDDRPDGPPELIFDGFGHKESRHNLANGFTWGPDGWLYAGHGRTSPSHVGRPGTPAEQRILCDGGVYRIHPTRLVFENFADGTTNPWGVDFDDFGECFVSNCVNPHLFHMIPGGHYEPWRNRASGLYTYERLPTIADHLHYPVNRPKEMRGETPEVLAMGGGHAHCGTLVYLGDRFPERYRNSVFMCNVHGRRVNNDILHRKGSGYSASHGKDFCLSGDPWFMGVTLRTGPDGNLFVSDWSDTGECHTYKPDLSSGRIFKISYGDAVTMSTDLYKKTDMELVELQSNRNDWMVRHARRILQERAAQKGWDSRPIHRRLWEMLASADTEPGRLRALWALHVTGGLAVAELETLLRDRHEHLRAWAVRLLSEKEPETAWRTRAAEMARQDPSPVVRLSLASALQRLPLEARAPIAGGLLSHSEDATDMNLPLMNWYGIEPLVAKRGSLGFELAVKAKIPLVRRYIARRVAEQCVSTGDHTALAVWVKSLENAASEVQLDLLEGVREGFRGRRSVPMPAGWEKQYVLLMKSDDKHVREQALSLAMIFGDPRAIQQLMAVVANTATSASERVKALESLIEARSPQLATEWTKWLADPVLRKTSLQGLTRVRHEPMPATILALVPTLKADEKAEALAVLSSNVSYASALLDALENKQISRQEITAYSARQIQNLGDSKLSARLKTLWGDLRVTPKARLDTIARLQKQLTPAALKDADLVNGKKVFAATCLQCHKLFGEGGAIGPDLTGTNRSNLEYLLTNLVDPNAEVARDYMVSVVRLVDGRVVTGIVIENSKNRVVVQTATERAVYPPDDIESVKSTSQSIMPEGQLESMTRDQVRDLIAYLRSNSSSK